MEKTLVIIKPSIPDEEFGENIVISREYFKKIFERILRMKGFKIEKRKVENMSTKTAEEHYAEKKEHPLFNSVILYITSGISEILSISGENAISEIRKIALKMRDKYIGNNSKLYNMIHASDSVYESEREHKIHFS
ncbi:MAG: nucleoside-diphosphate kinase [Candidatus Gracilibacteria bacterium]|nr:nucleoside-diphosphate kinase [Candidatus Gracilibacteria bacterium]